MKVRSSSITRLVSLFFALLLSQAALAGKGGSQFPTNPELGITPGETCSHPEEKRYPEGVDYCGRHVETETKYAIIRKYDQDLGYEIGRMDRNKFKIDHLIPLCAGGSNEATNLWPQHESVYKITDPLESELCNKMAQGRLLQKDAIELIMKAKMDLSQAAAVLKQIRSL